MKNPNDRDELARLLPAPAERDLPSGRQRDIKEFVMSRIEQDARTSPRRVLRRRLLFRVTALGATALAAVAAVAVGIGTVGGDPSGPDGGQDTAAEQTPAEKTGAARTFELAAAYAEAEPFTPPDPEQWIYIETRILSTGGWATSKGMDPDVTERVWRRADGTQAATPNDLHGGKVEVWEQAPDDVFTHYPTVSTLPTDPQELLDWVRSQYRIGAEGMPDDEGPKPPGEANVAIDESTFTAISRILAENLLPSDVTAALMRAAALIPGVTQSEEPIEVDGRQVIAVGLVKQGWYFEQVLLDPETYAYVGSRAVAVEDHVIEDDEYAAAQDVQVKKGDVEYASTRVTAAIVDEPGDTA